ncbi:FixH family protein [Streptosporangium carneum]|uniref:YtkA-like domain-containing protein n=1 Tax=Streptosporangium carneum TaxID=47481 RepID=A0A9W6I5N6_9ACTN|nr:FixH family protein [Streptosporangium carneum]GLK12557.1 hypothetical protein GCM10017600_59670 [Streptosporangium carneum]
MTTRTSRLIIVSSGVMLIVAGLILLMRPFTPVGAATFDAAGARHAVHLTMTPARAATPGSWLIRVNGSDGRPAHAKAVRVEPVMPQMGHAIAPLTATESGTGRFPLAGVVLPMPGQWQITVTIDPAGAADRVVIPVLITG